MTPVCQGSSVAGESETRCVPCRQSEMSRQHDFRESLRITALFDEIEDRA